MLAAVKVCPECKSSFDDDVEVCPNDDVELVEAPDALPENPALREVVEVSPSERTSMIDLEAIEAKRKERPAEQIEEEPDAESTPPPADAPPDPEATGSMDVVAYRKKKRREARAAAAEEAAEGREPTATKRERSGRDPAPADRTSKDQRRPRTQHAYEATDREDRTLVAAPEEDEEVVERRERRRAALSPVLAALGVLVLCAGLGGGVYFIARSSAVLTVTSVPPGAVVRIDAKEVGTAPVQKRVAVGNHTIELDLQGYEPFKEVVEVPSDGVAFLQPLRVAPPPAPPPPTPAQIADEIAAAAERLVAQGDHDAAFAKIKELVKAMPDDPRADRLFQKLDAARKVKALQAEKDRRDKGARTAGGKRAEARVAFQEGERLYAADRLDEAKEKYFEAVRLDPAYAEPHRALGRIFNRENVAAKVRYHLGRYLALGGADPDFKVREWLKQNPAP